MLAYRNEWVSRMESAVGIHFRRGKQQVSRLLSRWNLSVYSSVWTSRNPDFDLGVDFVDTLKLPWNGSCKKFCSSFKEPQRYMRRLENPKKQGDEVVFA